MADFAGLTIALMIALPLAAICIIFVICFMWRQVDDATEQRERAQRRNEQLISVTDKAERTLHEQGGAENPESPNIIYVQSPPQQPPPLVFTQQPQQPQQQQPVYLLQTVQPVQPVQSPVP